MACVDLLTVYFRWYGHPLYPQLDEWHVVPGQTRAILR